jgi:protein-disulfide isomerase
MPLLQQVLEKNPNDVKLVFKNLPLSMHKFARKAATAALAANAQGKYWEFHDKLLQNQSALSDATVQKIAEELGLDAEKFNKDMQDPAIQELIGRDVKDAQQAGITGTPTILVNGKLLKKRSLAGFQEIIDTELKKPEEPKEIESEKQKEQGERGQ